MKYIKIKMNRTDALRIGLLLCGSCGYPPNSHFSFGKRLCAHSNKCTGYKETSRLGKITK